MRTVSDAFRAAAFGQETDQVIITLLTITHPDLAEIIRLSSDPTTKVGDDPPQYKTVSRGEDFLFLPFKIKLPTDLEREAPKASISINNVTRDLVPILRSTITPAFMLIEVVMSGTPNVVEVSLPRFRVVSASYASQSVQLDLTVDGLASEPFPAMTFNPAFFPGIFNNQMGGQ